MKSCTLLLLVLVSVSFCNAYLITDILTEGTYGTGSNTGLLVVDFWPTGDDSTSIAFVVNFDGLVNGFELMDVVALHSGGNFSYSALGGFLADIWYIKDFGGVEITYHAHGDWNSGTWLSQWNSVDFGQTWNFGNGAGFDTYGDGDTLGWLCLPSTDWTSTPVTPVPESATLLLTGLGALFMGRLRRG